MECIGCSFVDYPPCVITSIYNSEYIENIIKGIQMKRKDCFVCHSRSQKLVENRIEIDDNCDQCGLCYDSCPHYGISNFVPDDSAMEKAVLKDLKKLNILFQKKFPNCTIVSEVKAKGNSRSKRIDIVIAKGNVMHLVKVLNNIDEYRRYERSYKEIVSDYSAAYSKISFKINFLVSKEKSEQADRLKYSYDTLESLHKKIVEE